VVAEPVEGNRYWFWGLGSNTSTVTGGGEGAWKVVWIMGESLGGVSGATSFSVGVGGTLVGPLILLSNPESFRFELCTEPIVLPGESIRILSGLRRKTNNLP
jgi:hypothetical protein